MKYPKKIGHIKGPLLFCAFRDDGENFETCKFRGRVTVVISRSRSRQAFQGRVAGFGGCRGWLNYAASRAESK
jgi:hypothetical protein